MISRDEAADHDGADPLAPWRSRFVTPDGLVYLDGNSLGMAPRAALDRLGEAAGQEWAHGLIRSWEHWLDLPRQVGDRLAPVIGAPAGSVVVHDSTTVNLYQLVHAALALAGDGAIAVDGNDFPTDRYVVAGIGRLTGREVRTSLDDLGGVAVVLRSAVDYRTAARTDVAAEATRAREAGAVTVWDLSHAAGAVEVDVVADGIDLAVGCSYKFLHGGPGAPAWSYVAPGVPIDQPMWGWFGQQQQFEMGDAYEPHDDVRRLLLGTPGILGLAAAEVGIGHVADAGMPAIAAKGRALTAFALTLCGELGLDSPSPADDAWRGAHVAVRVADADATHAALTRRGVVTDVRRPDLIRLGCAALTTRFVDVWDGVHAVADVTRNNRLTPRVGRGMSELTMPSADREAFLAAPRIGVLTIAREAGRPPLASPIWYEYEPGGDVVINVGRTSEKARLAAAAGAASLTVQTEELPYRFVTVGGTVTAEPADEATRRRIAARYLPAAVVDGYLATGDIATMFSLRLHPTTWHSNDYSRLERP